MARKIFSGTLPDFTGEITNPALRGSLFEIYQALNIRSPKLKIWGEGTIALPIKVKVDLPPLGNFQGIDIQPVEPVVIVFNLLQYPTVAPKIFTDRPDFPKDQLAHLYIATKNRPPAFCLVRGNMEDWYAGKRPADLVIRIGNWLRDAAMGELTQNGNQFDPLRIEGYIGQIVYDYDQFAEIIAKKDSFNADENFAVILFKRIADHSYQFFKRITAANATQIIKILSEAFEKENDELKTDHYHIGYLIWDNSDQACSTYQIDAPANWGELKTYASGYGIELAGFENFIVEKDINLFKGVPVVLGIKRPMQVIGYSGPIEFSNHVMIVGDEHKADGKIVDDVMVSLYVHNQPLTNKLAREISAVTSPITGYSMLFGCGALGSKIAMHIARSGQTNVVLVDPDELASHNLVRHALLAGQLGMNKAQALADEIKALYPGQVQLTTAIANLKDPTLQGDLFNSYAWMFDFTASEAFFNTLINADNLTNPQICRANLSDAGNIGIMLMEGKERNPRIDDLQISLYNAYAKKSWVREWLKREASTSAGNITLAVGVGCNSETTVLADDKISSHAAYFSAVIKRECIAEKVPSGKIFISRIEEGDNYNITTELIAVPPFVNIMAVNRSGWQIRFLPSVVEIIRGQMGIKMPHETGGVFIGSVNHKNKTIHVVDVITEPADSVSDEVCFHRGVSGLPEKVAKIHENSGGQLGYVGEWHTHPFGPNGLSTKDIQTVKKFKTELDRSGSQLPVFITVVTPDYVLPYVY